MEERDERRLGHLHVTLPGGVLVSALVAVNALGDVIDPTNGQVVAGARKSSRFA